MRPFLRLTSAEQQRHNLVPDNQFRTAKEVQDFSEEYLKRYSLIGVQTAYSICGLTNSIQYHADNGYTQVVIKVTKKALREITYTPIALTKRLISLDYNVETISSDPLILRISWGKNEIR